MHRFQIQVLPNQRKNQARSLLPSNAQQFANSLPDNQANTEDVSSWLPDPTLQSIVAKALGIEVSEITKEKSVKCRQSIFIRLIQLLLICPVWSMPQACLPFT